MGETEEWDIYPEESFSIVLYKLNDEKERFDKIEIDSAEEVHPHMVSDNILLLIDTAGKNAYLWEGKNVSVHMKFCAARLAPQVRDKHGSMSSIRLHNIDQKSESPEFKALIHLS